jgi:hypothetical protein
MDAESRLASSMRNVPRPPQSFPIVAAPVPVGKHAVTRQKAANRSMVHIGAG